MNKYIHHKMWDEITYPLSNVNGAPLKYGIGKKFHPHFIEHVIEVWVKLHTNSQTSSLKSGNGLIISSHFIMDVITFKNYPLGA